MDPIAFVIGYLYENALESAAFRKDVLESFVAVSEDVEAIVSRLEALEHNIDLKMVAMIAPQGEA